MSLANPFENLVEAKWRDVSFPTTGFTWEIRQDLAIHKPADRDGAHVEGTGVAPYEFTFDIPFFNTLTPAPNETWRQPLYPSVALLFAAAFADRTNGVLQHPELGQIVCKPNHSSFRWSATERAGIRCQASFIQTLDDDIALDTPSSHGTLDGASTSLDENLALAAALPSAPTLPTFPTSFSQFAGQIRGVVDQVTILEKQGGGALASIVGQVNALEDSVELATGSAGAVLWPLLAAGEAVKAAAIDLAKTLLQKSKNVAIYEVPADKMLGAVCADLGASLTDLIKLNPGIMSLPVVPAGAKIRYYA